MRSSLTFLALLVIVAGANAGLVHDEKLIDAINRDPSSTYVAGVSKRFNGVDLEEARRLLGLDLSRAPEETLPVKRYSEEVKTSLPDSFDAREQWPNYIHPIRDQQRCGSCWAFAASEVLSDRFAIASSGKQNVVLSPESLVSCDFTNNGCNGGNLGFAWAFLRDTGITTDACFPYTAGNGTAAACQTTCVDGSSMTYYKSQDLYSLGSETDIMMDIMKNGPVEAGFSVYKSFMQYKSGVYSHKWTDIGDKLLGGHAVKIIGWGTENGTKYWLVANSWNVTWGLDGYFKILRGKDNCGIESDVYAGVPAL